MVVSEQVTQEFLKRITVDIYCRVSTDPQEDNTSLDEQEAVCREYCKAHGLIVGKVHREVFSGYQYREREDLDLMRRRYCEDKIQGVVIRTLDRLSRSQVHNAILMEEMEHHNVTLYCVKENIDDTPMGKFIRMVFAFVAEMEREKIMDRTTTGRINKAKEGKVVSGNKAPYGWQWFYYEVESKGGKKEIMKEVITHKEQAPVLRWLAEQYADGVAGYNLMRQLNDKNLPQEGSAAYTLMQQLSELGLPWPPPSPSGIEWNERSIVRLVSDPRITGKNAKIFAYQNRKTKQPLEPIDLPDGTYPAIISEELFEKIQERRVINKADAIRASQEPEEYLLRAGFVRCGRCNKPMMAVKHRGKYIYRCTHTDMGHSNIILAKPLDARIWEWLQQLADHITLIEQAVKLATSAGKIEKDTEAIEKSIITWKAKAANYLSDLDDDTLVGDSRTAIRNALNNANKMVAQLEEEKAGLMEGMIDKEREREAYQEILDWCQQVKQSRKPLIYQRKRDFLRMLGIVVVIENEKPFYEHMIYHVEVTLPAIQELIAPYKPVNCDTSSPEDIEVTEQLVASGKLLDIEVLDHLIIGNPRFVSLKQHMAWG
jgi:site-specific DNA recombinase